MSHTIIGIFKNTSEAQSAVERLESMGFESSQIDIASNTKNGGSYDSRTYEYGNSTTKTEDTAENGIERFFKNLFSSDDDQASTYTSAAYNNQSVVTVYANNIEEANYAVRILDEHGAIDAHEEAPGSQPDANSFTGAGTAGFNGNNETTNSSFDADKLNADKDSIKVIREDLEVGKREVETGGVRLRSRIVERPVDEEVRLRTERVTVNRNPVNRPATEADFTAFKEGEVEMTESKEVPVVSKTARVVEEVSLKKDVTERTDKVHETLRNTEVDVEKIPGKTESDGFRNDSSELTNDSSKPTDY